MIGSSAKKTVFAIILLFVVMGTSGGLLSAGMMMDDGTMQNCPFMGMPLLCTMSPLQHASEWQHMFASIAEHMSTNALLMFLALGVLLRFISDLYPTQKLKRWLPLYRYKEASVNPLKLAFSRGVLHSMAF